MLHISNETFHGFWSGTVCLVSSYIIGCYSKIGLVSPVRHRELSLKLPMGSGLEVSSRHRMRDDHSLLYMEATETSARQAYGYLCPKGAFIPLSFHCHSSLFYWFAVCGWLRLALVVFLLRGLGYPCPFLFRLGLVAFVSLARRAPALGNWLCSSSCLLFSEEPPKCFARWGLAGLRWLLGVGLRCSAVCCLWCVLLLVLFAWWFAGCTFPCCCFGVVFVRWVWAVCLGFLL